MEKFIIIKVYYDATEKTKEQIYDDERIFNALKTLDKFSVEIGRKLQLSFVPCVDVLKFFSLIEIEYNGELTDSEYNFYSNRSKDFIYDESLQVFDNGKLIDDFNLPIKVVFKKVSE